MSAAPVTEALELAEDSILAALGALYPAGRAFWDGAPTGSVIQLKTFARNPADPAAWPCLYVAQHQDAGGQTLERLNARHWSGLILVRVQSAVDAEARAGFAQAVAAMAALPQPEGYALSAVYDRRRAVPPTDGIITRAAQWRVTIQRRRTP